MIPVFVITLREEPWKWKTMLPHFREHGIEPKMLYGISGTSLCLRPTNPYAFDLNGNPEYIHPCQAACVLSHITALQCGVLSGADQFIVAEDDAILPAGFMERWTTLAGAIPADLDILQCNVHLAGDKPKERINLEISHCYYPFGAAFNWWRRSAAERAIDMMRPVDTPVDIMFMRRIFPFLNHAIPNEPFIFQRTIEGKWPSSIGDKLKT